MARKRNRKQLILAGTGGAVLVAVGIAWILSRDLGATGNAATEAWVAVRRGPLVISVTESGTIKNREQVVVKSEVEGRTSILSLVAEGIVVEKGTLLVELDASQLEEQKAAQQITVINAEATFVRARENLAVTRSQGESDVAKAELDLRFAELDLEKYEQGEYPQQVQQAEAEIKIASEEVERAKEKVQWSRRLHEQRYLSRIELQADELALEKAQLDLNLAKGRKALLEGYTHRRDREALRSAIDQSKSAFDRTRRKTVADLVQAEAELKAKEQEFQRQKSQLAKIEDQIGKCRILAPTGGMVVYATTGRRSWRSDEQPLQEGQEVRERQELIYLPTASSMMVEVKVHESSLEKVRVGLPVRVTVDAVPGRTWSGRVDRIAVLPDATSVWLNPDLKVYETDIVLEEDGGDLRTGMSARAEIFVERHEDAHSVPVQCVVRKGGQPTVYVRETGGAVERAVKIGLDNNRFVHVLEGLEANEEVLLNPPLEAPTPASSPPVPPIPEAPEGKAPPNSRSGSPARGARGSGRGRR